MQIKGKYKFIQKKINKILDSDDDEACFENNMKEGTRLRQKQKNNKNLVCHHQNI